MKISSKYKVLSIVGGLFLFIYYTLYTIHYTSPPIFAAGEPCILESDVSKAEATGLASAPITGSIKVNVAGQKICVENERAGFVSYKLPTYDDLKSLYFDQARPTPIDTFDKTELTGDQVNINPLGGTKDHLYYINGTLRVKNNEPGGKSAVIFVKNDLRISASQLTTGSNGIVFVVGGNVYIWGDPNIPAFPPTTRVDAVIIAHGQICTAYKDNLDSGCPPDNFITSRLVINGGLISLNPSNSIKFRRLLTDNTLPAEKIHYEPKYLVILKDLFADTYQKWSEIQ